MTPIDYEQALARHFEAQGFSVETTARTNDAGIDLFARKGSEVIAIQAKMYGAGSRPVNRAMVFELFGAAAFFKCTQAILATDGRLLPTADEAAERLGIRVLKYVPTEAEIGAVIAARAAAEAAGETPTRSPAFEEAWRAHVMPLAGRSLAHDSGKTNRILSVDWSGLTRMTDSQKTQIVKIEIFRLAFDRLMTEGEVSRDWINTHYKERASSIVVRVLAEMPQFRLERSPLRLVRA